MFPPGLLMSLLVQISCFPSAFSKFLLENCCGNICEESPSFRRTRGALVLSPLLHREKIPLLGGGLSV